MIEKEGTTPEGLPYIVIITDMGSRNGYVGVFTDSILYGKAYDEFLIPEKYETSVDMNVSVHGGVTYSGMLNRNIIGAENPYFFGFDCNHLGDGKISPIEMNLLIDKLSHDSVSEKKILKSKYFTLYNMFPQIDNEIPKDTEYVIEQCFIMSKQLKDLELQYAV